MPLRFFFRRTRSAQGGPLPRGKRRRRALRIAGAAVLTVIGLLVASTAANLVLERIERSNAAAYGEKVRIDQGTVNASLSGETGPTIVLLSGLGTPAPVLDFAPLVRELTGFRVVTVEGFGYGYSDMTARPRTIENMSEELHSVLSKLAVDRPYILAGHSIAGFTTLYYANKYPAEVSAVIGIDPSVPAGMASAEDPAHTDAPATGNFWERLPSTTGLVRWAAAVGLADPAGDNYTQVEREQMRMLASWNYGNEALTDETNRMAENAAKLHTLRYPDNVPVLEFLSRETVNQQPEWLGSHERQLLNVTRHELVVLDGNHYLHWTQSKAMATKIAGFLSPAGTDP
jgi:pimeloyl-ACP methyl ester carboxylesterase